MNPKRKKTLFNHIPVMLLQTVDMLDINPQGIYVDGTLGGGGHAEEILCRLKEGRLIGIDQDEEAIIAASNRLARCKNFSAVKNSFHNMSEVLDSLGVKKIDGVLLDLGVSSFQVDTASRGFSYRHEGPLDMRMDTSAELTAETIVNTYDERHIAKILFEFGEEKNSRKIARAICIERSKRKIRTTTHLAELIQGISHKKRGETAHPAMRTFMALRIAVNNELEPLPIALSNIVPYLKHGGRIAVITFHSLEDRIVKNFFKKLENPCICPRDIPYCSCGKVPELINLTKKPITPAKSELERNSRSHSAKLRVAQRKIEVGHGR